MGWKPFHGKRELVKFEEVEKGDISMIQGAAKVFSIWDYMKAKIWGTLDPEAYCTWLWIVKDEQNKLSYFPELKKVCISKWILNPDDDGVFDCPNQSCENFFYKMAVAVAPVKKCPDCGIRLGKELYTSPWKETVTVSPVKWKPESVAQINEKKPKLDENDVPMTFSQKYPTLSKEKSEELDETIKIWKEKNAENTRLANLQGHNKNWKISWEQICYNLLLGAFELETPIVNKEFNLEIKPDGKEWDLLGKIAIPTESVIWNQYEKKDIQAKMELYNQHIWLLLNNLKNPQNKELRSKILKGDITTDVLGRMTAEDFLPEELKRQKEKIEEEVVWNQIIPNEITVIAKSYKDQGIVNIGKEDEEMEDSW